MAAVVSRANKRRKTTTFTHHGRFNIKPRGIKERTLSPTRRHNPQPPGLLYQSPLHSNAQPYAIWSPDVGNTRANYSSLMKHLDLTNFSSGPSSHVSPWEERGGPPTIHYSIMSTSRLSYRDPSQYTLGGLMKWPSHRPLKPERNRPAVGIIPPGLPRLSSEKNLVNALQGSDKSTGNHVWSNAALREVWHSTGNLLLPCKPQCTCQSNEQFHLPLS